jgi:hypothetical protein
VVVVGLWVVLWGVVGVVGVVNLGMTDVTADFHSSNGDQADARVFDFATDQLCQLALHLIADTLGTAIFFCHVLLPVTAPR